MLIYIRFSYNEQDRRALLPFCSDSDATEWRWLHYWAAKDKAQSPETARWCAESACRRSLDSFALSGGDCVNSAFWSQSVIERLLVWRTAEGLKRDQSPLSGLSGRFYMWLSPSCSLVGTMKNEGVKSFPYMTCVRAKLMVFWSRRCGMTFTFKGLFIFCSFNTSCMYSGAACVGFVEVYATNILHSMEKIT